MVQYILKALISIQLEKLIYIQDGGKWFFIHIFIGIIFVGTIFDKQLLF
jgi:hypothetical protein